MWTIVSLCSVLIMVAIIKIDIIRTTIAKFLIVNEVPQKSDVIIVLAGDSGDRLSYGAKLYQSGYADKVILSGFGSDIIQQAVALGIPESSILLEDQARTTFENAKYSFKIMLDKVYKSAIIVTSPYHTRRSSIIFHQRFKGIDLTICAVPYDPMITHNWWKDSDSTQFVRSEYLKLLWHYLFEWN